MVEPLSISLHVAARAAMAEASTSGTRPAPDFAVLNSELQAAALKATKLAATLPADLDFHRSLDKQFAGKLDACSEKVLSLTNKLLSFISTGEQSKSSKGKGKRRLEDEDDVVDKFNSIVVDAVDQLFERAVRSSFSIVSVLLTLLRIMAWMNTSAA